VTLPPREFISKAMADAKTTFDVFDAIVGRMEADAAMVKAKEAELASVTRLYLDLLEERNTLKAQVAILKDQHKSAWGLNEP